MTPSSFSSDRNAFLPLALLGVALPFLIAGSAPPTSTYFNQALAFGGCGLWLMVWAMGTRPGPVGSSSATRLLLGVGVLLLLGVVMSQAPWGQRLAPLGCLLLGGALMHAVARSARAGRGDDWTGPLMIALLTAGLLSVVVGAVQVFAPELCDGRLVAFATTPGRAIGNMRQPNQLSTLLLWAVAAAVWLSLKERRPVASLALVVATLVFGVAMTASRTGLVGVALLALWGLLDRRLPAPVRWMLVAMVPFYALCWVGLEHWLSAHGVMYYGDDQIKKTLHGDASSSRGRIWANTLALIEVHPWRGVGVGAFNFVWSMTPFPDRPVAFFDHSHNLPMQLAVESGLPLAGAVLLGLAWAGWRSRGALTAADPERSLAARATLFMLVMVGVHSLLEYPLWYVYFLLPAMMLAGVLTGSVPAQATARPDGQRAVAAGWRLRASAWLWSVTGAFALVASVWSTVEYWTVAVIFEPGLSLGEAPVLSERIARGQRSVLWGHHADYARVTMAPAPEEVFADFERPLFHLADTRLMVAYAKALAARGETDRAAHVAARLREFRNPASAEFFAACDRPRARPGAAPFPCQPDPALPAEMLRP